jgi:hypothetical protein
VAAVLASVWRGLTCVDWFKVFVWSWAGFFWAAVGLWLGGIL